MFDESAGRRERLVGNSIPSVLGSFGRTAFRMLSLVVARFEFRLKRGIAREET